MPTSYTSPLAISVGKQVGGMNIGWRYASQAGIIIVKNIYYFLPCLLRASNTIHLLSYMVLRALVLYFGVCCLRSRLCSLFLALYRTVLHGYPHTSNTVIPLVTCVNGGGVEGPSLSLLSVCSLHVLLPSERCSASSSQEPQISSTQKFTIIRILVVTWLP